MESEKPLSSKASIRPALMILQGTTQTRTFTPLAQERPEASTDKPIEVAKRREPRLFDVAKPPPEERMECGNALR